MPPLTAHDRFRITLRHLLRAKGTRSKLELASYCGNKSPSWVSNLLKPRAKEPYIALDDLWNIAGFFRVSVAELLGVPATDALDGPEQRLLVAARMLSPAVRDHLVSLAEALTLAARVETQPATALTAAEIEFVKRLRKQPQFRHIVEQMLAGRPVPEQGVLSRDSTARSRPTRVNPRTKAPT